MNLLSPSSKIALLLLLIPAVLFGQSTLRGTVSDSSNREAIIGANVVVVGTSLGAATDIDGGYMITSIPQRPLKVRVSCIGYEPKTEEMDFSANKEAHLDFQLRPAVILGEEVVVTAQMRGQLAAINQQVTSKTIVNVVSEEKIQELPDANAAEAIGRLPGVSVIRSGGEATNVVLRGLSSKFSNITVDGVRIPATDSLSRDVDLSMISQGSLAGIELYKTLTPDQDADAIAGAINLVTRNAPSERLLRIDLKGDYNYLMKSSKQYDVAARYGERFFKGWLGVQLQGNAEQKIRSREDIGYFYYPFGNPVLPGYDTSATGLANDYLMNSFTVDFTNEVRKRNGGQMILDLNTPDSGSVKLTGLYSSTQRNFLRSNRVYPGFNTNRTMDYNYRYTEQETKTVNAGLQGNNFLLGLEIDWNVSYAHSQIGNPFDYSMQFTETPGYASPPQASKDHPELYLINFAANNYVAAVCSSASYFKSENFDKERTAYANVSKKYTLWNWLSGDLKIGGKYREKNRWLNRQEFDDNAYLHNFYATGVDSASMMQSRFASYYLAHRDGSPGFLSLDYLADAPIQTRDLMGLYRLTPLINTEALRQWYDLNKNGSSGAAREYNENDAARLNDYAVTERISAGYIMNTFNFGQTVTLIAGVRVEKEMNDYGAKYTAGGVSTIGIIQQASPLYPVTDTTATYTETIWLPNAQVSIRPTDFLTVRLAAYRALARPDYYLRLPRFEVITGTPNPINLGNPNLKDTKAWNYEINTQVYSNTIGLLSLSAFYKKIEDLYHVMDNVRVSRKSDSDSLFRAIGLTWQDSPTFMPIMNLATNLQVNVGYNSKQPSYAYGIELEHQLGFSFLPGYLKNITLSYNISITRSETYIIQSVSRADSVYVINPRTGIGRWLPGTPYNMPIEVKRQSENQPEFYGNVALGYDIGGFSARASVFFQDEYVRQYSTDGQTDLHVDGFTKLDLAFRQEISRHLSLFLNINNVTNEQESTSQINTIRDWHLTRTAELYGTSAELGVRVSL